jgi:hypothetical protein
VALTTLNTPAKHHENTVITHTSILNNNGYNPSLTHTFFLSCTKPKHPPPPPSNTQKWARFTYIGWETRYITKRFGHTSINVTYVTKNTIQQLLSAPTAPSQNIYVHQIWCLSINMPRLPETIHTTNWSLLFSPILGTLSRFHTQ